MNDTVASLPEHAQDLQRPAQRGVPRLRDLPGPHQVLQTVSAHRVLGGRQRQRQRSVRCGFGIRAPVLAQLRSPRRMAIGHQLRYVDNNSLRVSKISHRCLCLVQSCPFGMKWSECVDSSKTCAAYGSKETMSSCGSYICSSGCQCMEGASLPMI